ncbi:MAG: hypothetical protein L0Z50_19150 [Verrucomicrobiales bacterium]|nr:hypothetical protein [Verrucomicrobiales bacterium]
MNAPLTYPRRGCGTIVWVAKGNDRPYEPGKVLTAQISASTISFAALADGCEPNNDCRVNLTLDRTGSKFVGTAGSHAVPNDASVQCRAYSNAHRLALIGDWTEGAVKYCWHAEITTEPETTEP